MKEVEWDYSSLAENYHKRAPYAPDLISSVLDIIKPGQLSTICDIGAGTGFLTREWADENFYVHAIEPNVVMREIGITHSAAYKRIKWHDTTASNTGLGDNSVDLVSYGSSFNVVDQAVALIEAKRIVGSHGWLFMVWNHRDITHGLQQQIERCINHALPNYQYGKRRQDQQHILRDSGLFSEIYPISRQFIHRQNKADVILAWESHATLKRQAGNNYPAILNQITQLIEQEPTDYIETQFLSKGWLARFK